jgi:hypothetical protein
MEIYYVYMADMMDAVGWHEELDALERLRAAKFGREMADNTL